MSGAELPKEQKNNIAKRVPKLWCLKVIRKGKKVLIQYLCSRSQNSKKPTTTHALKIKDK